MFISPDIGSNNGDLGGSGSAEGSSGTGASGGLIANVSASGAWLSDSTSASPLHPADTRYNPRDRYTQELRIHRFIYPPVCHIHFVLLMLIHTLFWNITLAPSEYPHGKLTVAKRPKVWQYGRVLAKLELLKSDRLKATPMEFS